MDQNPSQIPDDVLWQAFLYVTGDLSDGEDLAFEARLERDAVACEAVIEMTKLVCAASAGPVAPATEPIVKVAPPQPAAASGRSFAATAVSVVCCLMLLVMLGRQSQQESELASVSEAVVSDAELLLAAWIDSSRPLVEDERNQDDSVADELDVPEWMLAGLTLSDIDDGTGAEMPGDQGMPGDMELF